MSLAFDVIGDGDTPPIVCLPMFGTTRAVTAAALGPAFAGSRRRQVFVDVPGHGGSPPTAEATSEAVLDAVSSFIDAHDDGRGVLLAGCSYGAYLAAAVARRWPKKVRGLFLVCPGVHVAPEDRDLPSLQAADDEPGWLDEVAPEFKNHLDVGMGRRSRAFAAQVSELLVSGTSGDAEYRDRLHGKDFALRDDDARVRYDGPTTLVVGRQDRIVGFADQYRQLELYPNGTIAVLDEAGHYLPFEQPELLRALAQEWLRRCE